MNRYNESCEKMLELRPPRIAMFLVVFAAMTQLVLPASQPTLPPMMVPGIISVTFGFAFMLRAWWLFQLRDTAICPTSKTSTFITDDVYSLTRNPMYLGMILILLGIALCAGNLIFYAAVVVYALILNHVFCRYEERQLRAQFGNQYLSYAARVRRWL